MQNLALDLSLDNEATAPRELTRVEKWKAELRVLFKGFFIASDDYQKSVNKLCRYIKVKTTRTDSVNGIQEIFSTWLNKRCEYANDEARNIGHLTISTENLPCELRTFNFPKARSFISPEPTHKGKTFDELSNEDLMEYFFDNYEFEALESALDKAVANIEHDGFVSSANCLGETFGLISRCKRDDDCLELKSQKGRFIIEMPYYSCDRYTRISSLKSLRKASQTFELESQVSGLGTCVLLMLAEEESLRWSDDTVDSRTKVNNGDDVEAVFFKDKVKFQIKPDFFETLVSFVRSYSDKESVKLVQQ